jgi:hypothetical protein
VVSVRCQSIGFVAPSQLIDEMLEVGRHLRIRAESLLKALAHGLADRSARPVIERFNICIVCVWTFHDPFRVLMITIRLRRTKSSNWNLFPVIRGFLADLANFP